MSRVSLNLPDDAFSLRPVRIVEGEDDFREYSEVTGEEDGHALCYQELNMLRATGQLTEPDEEHGDHYALVDVLNEEGDIVDEYGVTKKGFNRLRSRLKLRWENRPE